MARNKTVGDSLKIRGFARLQVWEKDKKGRHKLLGDSGWAKNTITNDGKNNYIVNKIASLSGSKTPTHLTLATQTTAVAAADETLTGEIEGGTERKSLNATLQSVGTLRMTASWAGSDNSVTYTIGSIAVYNTSAGGTMGSGATYTTSQWATNQDVSATYEWRF